MYKAEDCKAGEKRKKPHTSVLPYLRAEQAEKASQTQHKVEPTVTELKDKQDREAVKTSLKHIHPSATEAELEVMAGEVMG